MARLFNPQERTDCLFGEIFCLLKDASPALTGKAFCVGMLPYAEINYVGARRLLFDYWDHDGRMSNHPTAFKNIARTISSGNVIKSRIRPIMIILSEHADLALQILDMVKKHIDSASIPSFPEELLKAAEYYEKEKQYDKFLNAVLKGVYSPYDIDKDLSALSEQERLEEILNRNNLKMKNLADYAETTLTKTGKAGIYGLLGVLYRAGYPDEIHTNCDPITLLEAANIYFNHQLSAGDPDADTSDDINNAYKYSETVYRIYKSPIAAWNMGYIWYLHGQDDTTKKGRKISIDAFHDVENRPDGEDLCLQTSLNYFIFAAKAGIEDAYASIGNICSKIADFPDEYPKTRSTLSGFMLKTFPKEMADFMTDLSDPADRARSLFIFQKCCYGKAASLQSINGMANYYNLLLKELMQDKTPMSFNSFKKKHRDELKTIREYIELLCQYRYPAAMTDYATLSLHMHPINHWLEHSRLVNGSNKILRDTPYDFIIPYYKQKSTGLEDCKKLLNKAAEITAPLIQTPWPSYYLALLHKKEYDYEQAYDCAKKACSVMTKYKYKIKGEDKKRILNLRDNLRALLKKHSD